MYGVIDIGSNTIRLSVYKVEEGAIKLLFNKKDVAGLAGYVDEKHRLSQRGIKKAINVVESFKTILKNIDVKEVFIFATASLRNVINTMEAVNLIKEKTGYKIRVISGKEEAMYDYYGAMKNVSIDEGILVDIGGGSTEIVLYKNKEVLATTSLPFGSLNIYSQYISELIPTKKEVKVIKDVINNELEKLNFTCEGIDSKTICGVGGTARAMCKLNNDFYDMPNENHTVERKNLKNILETLDNDHKDTLLKILRVTPDRIHTIVPGMLILLCVAKHFKCKEIVISEYGVREGYLFDVLQGRGLLNE